MPFDYLSVKLPESKKTGLNTIKIQTTLDKILFSLAMYPDMQLAEAFARVGNIRNYLPYHLGEETYAGIRVDIVKRRKVLREQPLVTIMQNLYDLWFEDYNINELYKMVTGKQTVEDDEIVVVAKDKKFFREDDLKHSEHLTFSNVVEGMDVHLEVEANFHSPDVSPGIWWVIWYDRKILSGSLRPFALMARLHEGKICYLQGVWPFDYLMNAIQKIIPLGYKAAHGDYVFLEIRAEMLVTKTGGKFHEYKLVRRIDSPTG